MITETLAILAMIIGITFLIIAILFTLQLAFGEELSCIQFNDGKTAVVSIMKPIYIPDSPWQYGHYIYGKTICNGHEETIAWFLEKEYKVTYWGSNEVYMIR